MRPSAVAASQQNPLFHVPGSTWTPHAAPEPATKPEFRADRANLGQCTRKEEEKESGECVHLL